MNVGTHLFWISSRAAGMAALLLASSSVVCGLMIGSKRRSLNRTDFRTAHEILSLATLFFVGLHGLALLADSWLNPGVAGITIPFASSYRPLWTGLGIVAGYGLAILGLSYYLRERIGPARWRRLHRLTAAFWLLAIVHTIGAGSDAGQAWFLVLAGVCIAPAALLIAARWLDRARPGNPAGRPAAAPLSP
ncbi:MAG: ferric reductase-like transmembrane domain-containing protein [Thermoleophilia bacterium]|nr:ferric reductase-like transmembrane domain-containing protein [Thermoleophilia bacterium]